MLKSHRNKGLPPAMLLVTAAIAGCAQFAIFEPYREVECLGRARVALAQAIAIAQQGGGTAIDADYREDEELGCLGNNPGAYDISLFDRGAISVVSIDADSGLRGPRQQAGVMNALFSAGTRFEGSAADMAQYLPRLSVTLSGAVSAAEAEGGKALAAWVEVKDQKPGYTVKIVQNGRVRLTWIDGAGAG